MRASLRSVARVFTGRIGSRLEKRLREASGHNRRRARYALRSGARSSKQRGCTLSRPPGTPSSVRRIPKRADISPADRRSWRRSPKAARRLRQELELSLLLGQVLMATKGWGVEEVERIYHRAREICEELGDASRLLQVMWGLIAGNIVRAEHRKTQALAREVIGLAKKQRDPVFQIMAHMELGGTAFSLGDSTSARKHFREADLLYDPRQRQSHIASFGLDLGLFSRMWATHALWTEGYPDQALDESRRDAGARS